MANRMTLLAVGLEKDVLLVLDKQQGKVSAVKGVDKDGNLQTVSPTHGGEFMQVDKNSDVFSNFLSNFFRKYRDTSGLELFSVEVPKNVISQSIFHHKKKVPCWGEHGTSTYWNTEIYFKSSSFIRLIKLFIR